VAVRAHAYLRTTPDSFLRQYVPSDIETLCGAVSQTVDVIFCLCRWISKPTDAVFHLVWSESKTV